GDGRRRAASGTALAYASWVRWTWSSEIQAQTRNDRANRRLREEVQLAEAAEGRARRSTGHLGLGAAVVGPGVQIAARHREAQRVRTDARRVSPWRRKRERELAKLHEASILDVPAERSHARGERARLCGERRRFVAHLAAVLNRVAAELGRGVELLEPAAIVEQRRQAHVAVQG